MNIYIRNSGNTLDSILGFELPVVRLMPANINNCRLVVNMITGEQSDSKPIPTFDEKDVFPLIGKTAAQPVKWTKLKIICSNLF